MAEDGQEFGDRLAGWRQLAGLSQQELAERSGLSARTVGNLERGRVHWPHPDTVRRLADALGLHGQARDEFVVGAGRLLGGGASGSIGTAAPDRDPPASGWLSSLEPGSGVPVPRQLPPGVRVFTGRKAELDFLACLPDAPGPDSGNTVVISAIGGTAGVGKTALALHWAHQMTDRFPDGQLYVNLRGYDPGAPVTPAEAVRGFLNALGVSAGVHPEHDAAAALYRSLLAERPMLILLDNAATRARSGPSCRPARQPGDHHQPQPPGRSRRRDGARLLTLGTLPEPEAVTCCARHRLPSRATRARCGNSPGSAPALRRPCGRRRTRRRPPPLPLDDLIADLRDESALWTPVEDDDADAVRPASPGPTGRCPSGRPGCSGCSGCIRAPSSACTRQRLRAGTRLPEARRLLGELPTCWSSPRPLPVPRPAARLRRPPGRRL